MKKYILIAFAFLMAACAEDSFAPAEFEYTGIKTTGVPTTIFENSGTTVAIPVYFGGDLENEEIFTVAYNVTGGVYGADYTIVGGSSASGIVTVAAGTTGGTAKGLISIVPVGDKIFEPNTVLTVTLGEASNGLSVGFPLKKSFTLTIANDDCNYDNALWVGTWSALEDYGADGTYGPYDVTFVQDGVDPNKFSFDNFYDSGCDAFVIFDQEAGTVNFPDQVPCANTKAISNSTGLFDVCAKKLTINLNYDGADWVYRFTKK